jgi:hypothetical protein
MNNALRNFSFQNMAINNRHITISELHKEKRQKQHKEVEVKLIVPKKEHLNQKMYQLHLLLEAGFGRQRDLNVVVS